MCGMSSSFFSSGEYCDRLPRRNLIQAGLGGLFGLSLPTLLGLQTRSIQAQSLQTQSGNGLATRERSVIFVALAGGPTQHETYDPKPDAPREYRGPFGVSATTLPGISFSDRMPRQAAIADRLAILRAVQHESGSHTSGSHFTQTGYYLQNPQTVDNEMPCIGSLVARVRGTRNGMPPFVSIRGALRYGRAAWLGSGYDPFVISSDPAARDFKVPNLNLVDGLTLDRLQDRERLLAGFDAGRKYYDRQATAGALDRFTRQAFETVGTDRVRQAFDLQREAEPTRQSYGMNSFGQGLLLARRLAERGVPFVSVNSGGWDNHGAKVCGFTLEESLRKRGPMFDSGIAALVTDLYQRGLDRDVLLICMGEFGRTPKVNNEAGRDHWGPLMSVLVSGGGLEVGQIVGGSDRHGGYPIDRPYRPENVLAMIYRHLGINPELTFADANGRPRYLLEERGLIRELL